MEKQRDPYQGGRDPVPAPGRDPPDRPPRIPVGTPIGTKSRYTTTRCWKIAWGNENRGRILCCAMSRALLEGYRALFFCHGVTLSSCDVGLHALIRAVSCSVVRPFGLCPHYGGTEPYVLCALRGNRYLFSNSARLEGDPESEEYASGMAARLSAIQQFYKSEKRRRQARPCLLYGLDGAVCSPIPRKRVFPGRPLSLLPGLPGSSGNGPVDAGTYLAAVGGLIRKVKHGRPLPDRGPNAAPTAPDVLAAPGRHPRGRETHDEETAFQGH